MDNIIPPLLILFSLIGLIFLFYRNPQKFTQGLEVLKQRTKKKKILSRFPHWQDVRNIWFSFIEKFLIRLRIILLRLERVVHNNLGRIRKIKNGELSEEKLSLFSLSEQEKRQFDEQNTTPLTQELIADLLLEEKKLLRKLKKNPEDLDNIRNLAHLYLYEGDLSSACWIVVKGVLLDPQDKVLQGLLYELKEKTTEEKEITEEKEVSEKE